MKKLLTVFIIFAIVFSMLIGRTIAGNDSIMLETKNILSIPSDKVVNFSVDIPNLSSSSNNFELLDKDKKVPFQIIRKTNSNVELKALLHFSPLEDKKLTLKYGEDVTPNYQTVFKPDFSGTYFVGIGSGMLYIVSLHNSNTVKIIDNKGKILFQGTLEKSITKSVPLNKDEIFTIRSSYPVFAEVSSLKSHPLLTSSDDISCVYGSYFVLFIPKEIFVSAYKDTHLKLYTLSGSKIFDGNIPERGLYKNISLKPDFYVVSSDNPVTVQFGCADDNVYFVGYGGLNAFKGVSFGNIVCSSLFPDTNLRIKTVEKLYPSVKLSKSNDFYYKNILKTFKTFNTEYTPIYVTYTKPVLVYSDANAGNIGGEQIPSVGGKGLNFVFRSGKIYDFQGIIHQRNVVIIASKNDTHITVNNKKVTLSTLQTYEVGYKKSYQPINISSDKPISVFEIGMSTSMEFLSMLLPLEDNSIKVVPLSTKPVVPPSKPTTPSPTSFLSPVFTFFTSLWHNTSNATWYRNIENTLKEFWVNISPYIKNFSKKIIEFFLPAAGLLYPYIHNYLPNISEYELAAIIFYILLVLIILLLIPKRRKEKPIPIVKLQEAKKKIPAFNVKVLEEKEPINIKAKKVKTIQAPTKIKKAKTIPAPEKKKAYKTIKPTRISKNVPVIPTKEVKKSATTPLIRKSEEKPKKVVPTPLMRKPVIKEAPKKVGKESILLKHQKPKIYEKPEVKGKEISAQLKNLAEKKETKEAKKPSIEEVPIQPKKRKKVSEETKSSLENLLERVKSESSQFKLEKTKEQLAPQGREVSKKEAVHPAVKHFQGGVVMDITSLTKILQLKKSEYLNEVFISASSQSKLDPDIKAKHRIGVIALTPIELRLVEDLANRIASKNSTAEALLIAKKIGAKDILVDDSPAIMDYQGVKIHSLLKFIQ